VCCWLLFNVLSGSLAVSGRLASGLEQLKRKPAAMMMTTPHSHCLAVHAAELYDLCPAALMAVGEDWVVGGFPSAPMCWAVLQVARGCVSEVLIYHQANRHPPDQRNAFLFSCHALLEATKRSQAACHSGLSAKSTSASCIAVLAPLITLSRSASVPS